ncbi:prolactin-releasing peptide isoform X1 [Myiozetetes cayanensis]|uniref:prolactin-releasing peptide isoform X1 n=1 Tax=Myiozetetes cayanensis TaxID=478635 RepID=UPI002160825D|nr:prolactin-releasing peptide isoform X1 [Myiozetetes cayanensis]
MKLGATCLLCLLLACLTLPVAHGRILERSMEIRSKENMNPDIDPSWYTGRGIRPVGRFGRRQTLGEGTHPMGGRQRPCAAPHPPREERNP